MSLDHTRAVLFALFHLGRRNLPASVAAACRLTALRPKAVQDALLRLDRAGLVDAERVRLTLPGLAVATSLSGTIERRREASPPAVAA